MNQNGIRKYPRKLGEFEKELLFYLLPEDRKGYAEYRAKIQSMIVIGEGRFGDGNLVLGFEGDIPDLSAEGGYASLPVFACGQVTYDNCKLQLSIHEFFDNKIETSIDNLSGETIPKVHSELGRWSYSYWKPGGKSPFPNDKLREINVTESKGEIVLAISIFNHSAWLYESVSGVNHIIPVTNFINELLRGNRSINRSKGIDMNYIFSNLGMFSDSDFRRALVQYNKQWRKVDLHDTDVVIEKKKKWFFGRL
jgi:hypothetical protein